MRKCPRCGTSYPADARFCAEDGVQLFNETDDPYVGQVFLKQFEVREICGRGSMGTVYRAWQTSMEREVAVKVLHKQLLRDDKVVKRFHREARASARLSHPNIITVYMVGDTDDGVPFIVMEYVKGFSLDATCAEKGPLPTVRAIHIVKQIAAALAEAHHQSIVHRDLKPENIILSSKKNTPDYVKVLDFGIAKILYDDTEPLTQTGAIFGTPHYLAPEQASGADIDHRCDLYALGVILFRMVTGRLPFSSSSGMEVLIQHIKQQPPRPRDILESIPQPLEEVILKALEKSPEERWQSAEQLSEALDRVVDQLRTGAVPMVSAQHDVAQVDDEPTGAGEDQAIPARPERPEGARGTGIPAHPERPEGARGTGIPDHALPPTQHGEEALPRAQGTDQVIVDGDPAQGPVDPESPTLSSSADALEKPPTTLRNAPTVSGSETMGMMMNVMGRRRLLFHLVLALISLLGGSAVGAAAFWSDAREEPVDPGPEPDPQETLVPVPLDPDEGEAAAALDSGGTKRTTAAAGVAAKPKPATRTKEKKPPGRRPKARPKYLPLPDKTDPPRRTITPVGPAPSPTAGTKIEPRPKPKPRPRPKPKPKPSPPDHHGSDSHDRHGSKQPPADTKNDDFYDLVE